MLLPKFISDLKDKLETFHTWHSRHLRDPTLVLEANAWKKEEVGWLQPATEIRGGSCSLLMR